MKRPIFTAILLALLAGAASAQATDVKTIDAYAKTVDAYTKKNAKLVFADTSDYTKNSKAKWRKFASEKALDVYRKKSEAYTVAYVWRRNNKVVAANFSAFSPSGDWIKYVYHFFREDGSLAKAAVDYRTFNGDLMVLHDFYFDAAGKQIKRNTKYKNLTTGKLKKPTKDLLQSNQDLLTEGIYKSVKRLPFSNLLNTK